MDTWWTQTGTLFAKQFMKELKEVGRAALSLQMSQSPLGKAAKDGRMDFHDPARKDNILGSQTRQELSTSKT